MTDEFNHPADDDFRIRTIDTGTFRVVDADDDPGTLSEPLPADDLEDTAPADPVAAVEDEFTTVTVEPDVPPRPSQPSRPAGRTDRSPRQVPKASTRLWLSTLLSLLAVALAAMLVSTIFSLWTRPTFFSDEFRASLNQVQATQQLVNIQPSPIPTNVQEVRIGIIAGHSGPPQDPNFAMDPGAVCDDGLTELEINEAVARRVVTALQRDQYTVELLQEFDPQLKNYKADVLISIHTNDCGDYGAAGTGFNIASAAARATTRGDDERLLDCLIAQYGATTGLPNHAGLTHDMTDYHTFSEVSIDTPTAIIEIGFMRNDRAILTQNPDLIAQGIANGVRCFLRPELYGETTTAAGQ
ncbi:MAG: N-acetylmuramoyl-L-alanine amidase [Anaerolineae bacterium]|nr:N-acetylmuramoyl-L-alanine amidase [Anaerolineae bacterium]